MLRKNQPDGTIAYEIIEPLTNQQVFFPLEGASPKICRDKFIKSGFSNILSTKEEFLIFCEWIEIWEVINRPHKILKSNTGDSSKKLGYDIGQFSSTPCGEGRIKGKNNPSSSKRNNCLLHGLNTHDTNYFNTLCAQDEKMKPTYAAQ